jgi:hypothetical protein
MGCRSVYNNNALATVYHYGLVAIIGRSYSVDDDKWQQLTGQTQFALCRVDVDSPFWLHRDVLLPWQLLVTRAAKAGFDLRIASAWRGVDRQRLIWNGKARGERPVLDDSGKPLDVVGMSETSLLFAILRWSAIPGCSRHHWGTDLDVFDGAAVSPDYAVQLTAAECTGDGPFTRLHEWLDFELEGSADFFRPYDVDRGGIAPERWHLSCRPVAAQYDALLDESRLIEWILTQDIALKETIRAHWHDIFHRYVLVNNDRFV